MAKRHESSMADCRIFRLASFHNLRGMSRWFRMTSFSGTQEPRAPTTSDRAVPRWPYFSVLSAAARYRFAGSSKGMTVVPPSVTATSGMLRPSSSLSLGTSSIPRSQSKSVSMVCTRSSLSGERDVAGRLTLLPAETAQLVRCCRPGGTSDGQSVSSQFRPVASGVEGEAGPGGHKMLCLWNSCLGPDLAPLYLVLGLS